MLTYFPFSHILSKSSKAFAIQTKTNNKTPNSVVLCVGKHTMVISLIQLS